jgi:hypothetical protein
VRDLVGTVGTWRLQARPLDEAEAARALAWLRSGTGPRPSDLLREVEQLTEEARRLLREQEAARVVIARLDQRETELRGLLSDWRALGRRLGVTEVNRKLDAQVVQEAAAALEREREQLTRARAAAADLYAAAMARGLPPLWDRSLEASTLEAVEVIQGLKIGNQAAEEARGAAEAERDQAREELERVREERDQLVQKCNRFSHEAAYERDLADVAKAGRREVERERDQAREELQELRARLVREQEAAAVLAAAVDRATATATAAEQARDQATAGRLQAERERDLLGQVDAEAAEQVQRKIERLQKERKALREALELLHYRHGATEHAARQAVRVVLGEEVTDG